MILREANAGNIIRIQQFAMFKLIANGVMGLEVHFVRKIGVNKKIVWA